MSKKMNVLQPAHMQASVVSHQHNSFNHRLRKVMRTRIYDILQRKQPSKTDAASQKTFFKITNFVEDKLMKSAKSEEEYSDLRDLEGRVDFILRQLTRLSAQRRAAKSRSPLCEGGYPMSNADTFGSSNLYSSGTMGVTQDPLNHPIPMLTVETSNEQNLQGMQQSASTNTENLAQVIRQQLLDNEFRDMVQHQRQEIQRQSSLYRSTENNASSSEQFKGHCFHCRPSYVDQRPWLRFLLHVCRCKATEEDECESKYCFAAKKSIKHIQSCKLPHCPYGYCRETRKYIVHYKQCKEKNH